LRPKDYLERPQTLGQHLKKRRKELGLLQREAAHQMGIDTWTYLNWEKDKTKPATARFRPVVAFLGYDPSPEPTTLAGRLEAKRRAWGTTHDQVAEQLGWDPGTLTRYLNGTWPIPVPRKAALERLLSADRFGLLAMDRPSRRLKQAS
jgi:transcriptional regulator with XRE-family HTH domain